MASSSEWGAVVVRSEGSARPGAVQSLARALGILEAMAEAGGALGLSELADTTGLPMPTIHRITRTLVDTGYVRQQPNRQYALGPRLIGLGESAGRLVGRWAHPYLRHLVEATGETANLAVLEGDAAVYIAQVPSQHAMRMYTEVGRRVPPHCSGVGKALLAQLPVERVEEILNRTGMPLRTEYTVTDPDALHGELERIRARGYAHDDHEQEIGVRCVAAALIRPSASGRESSPAALSVSGPATRLTDETMGRVVPLLVDTAAALAAELGGDLW